MSNPIISQAVRLITITPTVLNNDAYDANDVIFDTTLIPDAAGAIDRPVELVSLAFTDKADQTAANLTFVFLNSNVSYGTADSAPGISAANSFNIVGQYVLASASILDHGNAKFAHVGNLGLIMKPETGHRRLYIAMASAGTPTYTTGCIQIQLGFRG